MKQYVDKSALLAEIENKIKKYTKRGEESDAKRDGYGMYWGGVLSCLNEIRTLCDTLEVKDVQEEPVSNDLEEAARKAGQKYFPDKDNIWARSNYEAMAAANAFKEGSQWQKGNLWKNAQGNDLPEIDREVVVLYQPYQLEGSGECAVGFAHRPPERWYGRNLDGEEHVFEPKTYDKGEWNIPNVVWWLDLDLPIKGE